MCEKRIRKIKKGSHIARLREARRIQRLHWLASPTPADEAPSPAIPEPVPAPQVDKATQNRVILELAWKTIVLMQKNRLIQQKITALQRETSEFLNVIMNNPENRRRYMQNLRLHAAGLITFNPTTGVRNMPIKLEPKD